jgi:hypothetical protein
VHLAREPAAVSEERERDERRREDQEPERV